MSKTTLYDSVSMYSLWKPGIILSKYNINKLIKTTETHDLLVGNVCSFLLLLHFIKAKCIILIFLSLSSDQSIINNRIIDSERLQYLYLRSASIKMYQFKDGVMILSINDNI